MEREEIFEVVSKHLRRNVEGLEGVTFKLEASMAEYGASSLDMVEVVSCTIRELGLKVPRTELVGARNLGELVEILARASGKVLC